MRVCFVFANPAGFSGQFVATKLLLDYLPKEIERISVPLPAWDGSFVDLFPYLIRLIIAWARVLKVAKHADSFYINAGQSAVAILRDGIALVLAGLSNQKMPKIISFNGHLFTLWSPKSLKARLFTAMCNRSDVVTVVGPNQKNSLCKLGVKVPIRIVDNASEIKSITISELNEKHKNGPISALFLGNLLETKGYPIFLEALEKIARENSTEIDAILAGEFIRDTYPERFGSTKDAADWVSAKIDEINKSSRVRVKWLRGVAGAEKYEVLKRTEVLVFPSRYPVEAQPFVLLEGLASGCALLASTAGEIPTTLSADTALIINPVTVESVTNGLTALRDRDVRIRLASRGLALFENRYTLSRYIQVWIQLFSGK